MPAPLVALGIGAGLKALGGLLGGISRAKAAKAAAKNEQIAAQYKMKQKQKGLNRRSTNFASLLKSLKREGWYGPEYMQQYGTPNLRDWQYDPVPLGVSPGTFSSALGGALRGGVQGVSDWYENDQAAKAQADAETAPTPRTQGRG